MTLTCNNKEYSVQVSASTGRIEQITGDTDFVLLIKALSETITSAVSRTNLLTPRQEFIKNWMLSNGDDYKVANIHAARDTKATVVTLVKQASLVYDEILKYK